MDKNLRVISGKSVGFIVCTAGDGTSGLKCYQRIILPLRCIPVFTVFICFILVLVLGIEPKDMLNISFICLTLRFS